jgi:hypothetical protein
MPDPNAGAGQQGPIAVNVNGDSVAVSGGAFGADAQDGSYGVGIVGQTDGGVGVQATSTSGTALSASSTSGRAIWATGGGDPLVVINHTGTTGNPALWFQQDQTTQAFLWWDQSHHALNLGTPANNPTLSVLPNGNVQVNGTLMATVDIVLTGADCAEEFDVAERVEPGMVVVLRADGTLEPSQHPYDKKVAGVVSGAGCYRPGLVLDRQPCEGRLPVALVGKVYCKVDAQYGSIEMGDLLTTSPTPGHAMKADDPTRSFGAVIGKALRPLETGQELIPILVTLQ